MRERIRSESEWSFTEDCGFPVRVTGSGSELIIIRDGKNKDEGAFPVLDRFSYSETWTNLETRQWFVIRGHVLFNEVEATTWRARFSSFASSRPDSHSSSRTPMAMSRQASLRLHNRADRLTLLPPGSRAPTTEAPVEAGHFAS